jgi:hypothetical protein
MFHVEHRVKNAKRTVAQVRGLETRTRTPAESISSEVLDPGTFHVER